jgi:hypothetical protein
MDIKDKKTQNEIGASMILSILIWKYGNIVIDEDNEEWRIITVPHEEIKNYGRKIITCRHDKENKISYYGVKKETLPWEEKEGEINSK